MPGLFLVEEEYQLSLLAAESAFVEEVIGKITDPGTDWGSKWAQFHGQGAPSPTMPARPP